MLCFNRVKYYVFLIGLLFFYNCKRSNPFKTDVSSVNVSIQIYRWDSLLFEPDNINCYNLHNQLNNENKNLYAVYFEDMLGAGPVNDSLAPLYLERFVNDKTQRKIYNQIKTVFGDLTELKQELENAFKYLKYYYPDAVIPTIVVYNSAFNSGVYVEDSCIAIGLEMYLGTDNEIIKAIPTEVLPQFIKNNMHKKNVVIDVMRGWFDINYLQAEPGSDFLTQLIHQGKILYALDAFLPEYPDSLKIRWPQKKLDWCLQNEKNIWKEIIDKNILYSTDQKIIEKYINEAPFTAGLPQESPGRVGCWMGWQMVKAYMNEFPQLKLPDLVKEKNPKKILKYYKPRKQ